jgi:hypothetical protein
MTAFSHSWSVETKRKNSLGDPLSIQLQYNSVNHIRQAASAVHR